MRDPRELSASFYQESQIGRIAKECSRVEEHFFCIYHLGKGRVGPENQIHLDSNLSSATYCVTRFVAQYKSLSPMYNLGAIMPNS